jgi:hypothetical protein
MAGRVVPQGSSSESLSQSEKLSKKKSPPASAVAPSTMASTRPSSPTVSQAWVEGMFAHQAEIHQDLQAKTQADHLQAQEALVNCLFA